MSRGGARIRSGPPPDPNALRRERDRSDWIHLPAVGRQGEPPEWPLTRPTKRELAIWEQEWRRPQAVMWEASGLEIQVALFVRTLREAETFGTKAATRTELRRQMDSLGLTPDGLLRNRWVIATEVAAQPRRAAAGGSSVKDRVKVITGGGGA